MLNHRLTRRSLFAATATLAFAQRRPPNIVWFMYDDLGSAGLGCYGQEKIQTPHSDRLAREGTRYTACYAGGSVCAPSRSVLMTGMHMGHTSIRSNPGGVPILPTDITVAEVLKKAGYATGCFGKWGLGDINTNGVPWKKGFDEFYGYLHQVHAHWYYPRFLFHNEKQDILPGNENGKRVTYSQDSIADKALAFIRRNAAQPFLCYVPLTIPHMELLVPDDSMAPYRGKIKEDKPYVDRRHHYADQPEPRTCYAGMVSRLDSYVGRIMALLKELNLDNDTIVFFTSDNGGATRLWGEEYFKSNGPFRGHKQNMYEGGIRTPMIARWPGKIKAGSTSAHQWYFADFLATASEIAGVKPHATDGLSVLPVLMGKKAKQHDYMYWEMPRQNKDGTFPQEQPLAAIRMGDFKAVRPKPDAPLEIYNLKLDPAESRDLASSRPDLLKKLDEMMRQVRTQPRTQVNPEQMAFPHS